MLTELFLQLNINGLTVEVLPSRLIEQALCYASISTIVGIQARGLLCVSGGLD
jgi:hypothetical protein